MKKQELFSIGRNKFSLDNEIIEQTLCKIFNLSKEKLFITDFFEEDKKGQILSIFQQLSNGYPIEFITNSCEFYGSNFFVNENCLIPRIDTEILVNEGINFLKENISKKYNLLDIGTGCGNIIISILKNFYKNVENAYGIDIDEKSLKCGKINSKNILKNQKIIFKNVGFTEFDYNIFNEKNLLIVANLPYIKEKDFENMSQNVINFERNSALYGGKKTGFEMYEDLVNILLNKSEIFESLALFIEIGFDQFEISKNFLTSKGLKFEFFKDTNKINRVIKIIF